MQKRMKILVTGGAGLIGSHLVRELLRIGEDVIVLDNLSTGRRENVPASVRLIEADMKSPEILTLFEPENFDAVVHLAAQTTVGSSLKDPMNDAEENIFGTLNVLRAAIRNGAARLIFASTAAIYGDVPEDCLPIEESRPAAPMSFYGLSKFVAENYIKMYHDVYGLNYVILRFANVFGELQGESGEGGVISLFAIIHAEDIAAGICKALTTNHVNAIYNLSTQTEISVNHILSIFSTVAGAEIEHEHVPVRQGDIFRSCLSNRLALKKLDWQPRISLEEGIERTYPYICRKV